MKKITLFLLSVLLLGPALLKAQINVNTPVDGLYKNPGIVNRTPIPLPSVRKADIMWSKRVWRTIDFRDAMNREFYYPIIPHQSWKSFITILLDAIKQGKITAYDISPTDELLVPITYQEIMSRETDTIHKVMKRPYPPYNTYDTTIVTQFDPTTVKRLRIKEDWYFDKQRSQMLVRIEALCPVMMTYHEGKEVPTPLFWVSYPQARKVLARHLAFNPQNPALQLSYDDIFIKRLFQSYIYKVQNVYDRRISDYAKGVQALEDARRIQQKMFDFEQYLWQY